MMARSKNLSLNQNNNDEVFFNKEKLRIETLISKGELLQARKRVDRLCKKFKNNPESWFISGVVCVTQNDFKRAIISYKQSITLAPSMPISYLNLGIAFRMNGQYNDSIVALTKAVELQPTLTNAYRELGVVSHTLGHYEDAVKYIKYTVDSAPNDPMTWVSLGNVHEQNNNNIDAEACYQKALDVDAKSVAACLNLGNVLKAQKKIIEAENCYKIFLIKAPNSIDVTYNLAVLYQSEGRLIEAESHYRKGISIDVSHIASNNNLGLVLLLQNKFEEAINVFKILIKLNPKYLDARRNLALVYREVNELFLAEQELNNILKLDHDNVIAMQERSLVVLQQGDFKRGWLDYEWRLKNSADYSDYLPFPIWDGSDISKKSILLFPEQGVGDEIMFSSCINDVTNVSNNVILVCDARMKLIFERSFPAVKIIGQTKEFNLSNNTSTFIEQLPAVDVQLSMASLPMYFRTEINSFKKTASGYLQTDVLLLEKWKARYKILGDGMKIGISWRGGHISNTKLKRSVDLEKWGEIFKTSNVQFVNLQYGDCATDLQIVKNKFGITVNEWKDSDPLVDMDDFSAKIKALDLVISIDNSTVHLAGSLGVDTWLLQPFSPDWRWLPEQIDSYWYSSIRQYRQCIAGKWEDVLKRIAADLLKLN
ncbi:hypothetical protein MNBD_GAMMA05-606 [hydrothermal vent metagenome]|uniref:Uncharacterized protein n=1 Tax=hydrothermal vent metagenome TaxID=652676 RepID=A0A3B0WL54_9ZZZZ